MANDLLKNIGRVYPSEYLDSVRLFASDDSLAFKKIYSDEYTPQDANDRQETFTRPLWYDNQSKLTKIYTSSNQSFNTKIYYRNVYGDSKLENGTQFSIAYGDIAGFGSTTGSNEDLPYNVYESKAIYLQYRNLLIDNHTSSDEFNFQNFYAISVDSLNMGDSIALGRWQLSLSKVNSDDTIDTGTTPITLIDDSVSVSNKDEMVYKIKEGTIANGLDNTPLEESWGYFYPKNGVILLNASVLSSSQYLITDRCDPTGSGAVFMSSNADRLFTSISGAMAINDSQYAFQALAKERLESIVVFVKVLSEEFNYTNNPSCVKDLTNYKIKETLLDNGFNFSYITQVGLYNDDNELLAVAKLSKPIRKNRETETVIRVRIRN